MNTSPTKIFRELEPPPGGQARLRLAMASETERTGWRQPRRWAPAFAAILLVTLVLPFASRDKGREDQAREALESVLRSPANGFESRTAKIKENTTPSTGIRLVVMELPQDVKDS